MPDFAATVDDWVRESEARLEAVFKESTSRVISLAQARIPVDTGFARASVQVSLSEMPSTDPGKTGAGGKYPYDAGIASLVIAGAELGQTIYVGWTAAYAGALEYGHSKQAPSGFVRLSAQQWPQIVAEVTMEAKARAGAN